MDRNVECWGQGPDFKSFGRSWTGKEWLTDPTMSLTDYPLVAGEYIVVTCRSGNEEYYDGFYIEWSLDMVDAGESVSLWPGPRFFQTHPARRDRGNPTVIDGACAWPLALSDQRGQLLFPVGAEGHPSS